MGIKDFSKAFKARRVVKWRDLSGKSIAVDAMTEIWRAALGAKNVKTLTDKDGNPTLHISVILANLIEVQSNGVKSVWIFDYDKTHDENVEFHNPAKIPEIMKRRKRRDDARRKIELLQSKQDELFSDSDNDSDKDNNDEEIAQQEKRAFSATKSMINDIKLLLNCFNVSYIEAPSGFEGEQIAAYLSSTEVVDAVYSGDTDPIPFGAKVLLRKNPRDKKIYEYTQTDILNQIKEENTNVENPTLADIRKICAILGSDYSKRTRGVGPKTVKKKYNELEIQDDQKKAINEFKKMPNMENIKVHNDENKAFTNCYIDDLIDWLVNEKSFTKLRVTRWIEKIMEKKDGKWVTKPPGKKTTKKVSKKVNKPLGKKTTKKVSKKVSKKTTKKTPKKPFVLPPKKGERAKKTNN